MPVAIITGAGGGIGQATALALAATGHTVVLAGRTQAALETAAAAVGRAGGTALAVTCDVTRPEDVGRLVTRTLEAFERIDVLVNAAGYAPMVPTADVTPGQWRQIIDTNLSSAFFCTRAIWPIFQRQHLEFVADHREQHGARPLERGVTTGGVIVNISSESSRDPFPGLGVYGIAKVGLNMLTHVTAREGEPFGIRVLAVAPAAVETAMFRALLTAEQVPSEEVLHPEEVAAVIVDFVGGALRYASGETLFIHRRM